MRPLICRLWGVMESLPCPYVCRPEGGFLADIEGYRLIAAAWRAGGGRPDLDTATDAQLEMAFAASTGHLRSEITQLRARGQAGEQKRTLHSVPPGFRRPASGGQR